MVEIKIYETNGQEVKDILENIGDAILEPTTRCLMYKNKDNLHVCVPIEQIATYTLEDID